MSITAWPTIAVDAIDMAAAARTLVGELGPERAGELADELLALTLDDDDLDEEDDDGPDEEDEEAAPAGGPFAAGLAKLSDDELATIELTVRPHYDLRDAIEAELERHVQLRMQCLDCDVHTGKAGQYPYHCPDELWHAVVPGGRGMLCLDCLARRLDAASLPWPWTIGPAELAAEMERRSPMAVCRDYAAVVTG